MTDGRRQFALPEEDQAFLNGLGLPWEAVQESGTMWLVLHEYGIQPGYNVQVVSVSLRLPTNYPDTQIDMAYYLPHLARADGQPIAKLSDLQFDGRIWQGWSRHRTPESAWRPGLDGVRTHLVFMNNWLEREVRGGVR